MEQAKYPHSSSTILMDLVYSGVTRLRFRCKGSLQNEATPLVPPTAGLVGFRELTLGNVKHLS